MGEPFRFKQFSLAQDRCAMKVGTDGVLLGAWAPAEGAQHALDVGTGTGLIALMLAQRFPALRLDALEIDPASAAQAAENVAASPFADRIAVQAGALQTFFPPRAYDLIVSNPPFFAAGPVARDPRKGQGRHEHRLPLQFLLHFAAQHLSEQGRIALILPIDREAETIQEAGLLQLHPEAICQVRPTPQKPLHRSLLSLRRQAPRAIERQTLTLQSEGTFTTDYQALTQAFHPFW